MTRDPIEYEGGENLYSYVNGRPMRFVDVTGLEGQEVAEASRYVAPVVATAIRTAPSAAGAGVTIGVAIAVEVERRYREEIADWIFDQLNPDAPKCGHVSEPSTEVLNTLCETACNDAVAGKQNNFCELLKGNMPEYIHCHQVMNGARSRRPLSHAECINWCNGIFDIGKNIHD